MFQGDYVINYSQKKLAKNRYFEPKTALNRLFAEAPYLPRCSDNKTAQLVRPKKYAINYPYMQVNPAGMVSWLIFDLDHSNSSIWEDESLPAPNIIVRNRNNGHAHLFYAIKPVCTTENARPKPIQYMKRVYEAMALRLKADKSYSGPVAKTPGHPWWLTSEIHNVEYDLDKLADYLDLTYSLPWAKKPDLDSVSHSRHCLLFEELRFYAYSKVRQEREIGTYQSFYRLLENFAHRINNYKEIGFSSNLRESQIKSTVKSVSRWTWDRYTGNPRPNIGTMRLSPETPLKERQKLSAERTHGLRKQKTENRIKNALRRLEKAGAKISITAISEATKLTRQTVAKYKALLTPSSPKATQENLEKNVKYGLHQITATLRPINDSKARTLKPDINIDRKFKKGLFFKFHDD